MANLIKNDASVGPMVNTATLATVPPMDDVIINTGDIVKIREDKRAPGDAKSHYAVVFGRGPRGTLDETKEMIGFRFQRKKGEVKNGRQKYLADEPSGSSFLYVGDRELLVTVQGELQGFRRAAGMLELIWSSTSDMPKPDWYDNALDQINQDRERKIEEKMKRAIIAGSKSEQSEDEVMLGLEENDDVAIASIKFEQKENSKEISKEIVTNPGIKIMQWNQKALTHKSSDFDGDDDMQHIKNLYKTIRDERPAVIVMEEVTRKGKESVAKICEMLNDFNTKLKIANKNKAESGFKEKPFYGGVDEENWAYGVSEPVDVRLNDAYDKGREYGSEIYAVIYQKSLMGRAQRIFVDGEELDGEDNRVGQVLFKDGFAPHNVRRDVRLRSEEEADPVPVETIYFRDDGVEHVQKDRVDMKRATDVFEIAARIRGGVRSRFLHRPVLFHFPHCSLLDGPISILANHLAASEMDKSMQNIIECAYVQHLATELKVKHARHVVLLGDFNVSQCNNEAMWNEDDLPGVEDDEELDDEDENGSDRLPRAFNQYTLLQPIRTDFQHHYLRVIDEEISTNVYPFLGGLTAMPAHNDDIWLPISPASHENNKFTHTSPDRRIISARVVPVPRNVLHSWAGMSDMYKVVKKGSSSERVPRAKITQRLAYLWSDHKPIWARIWLNGSLSL